MNRLLFTLLFLPVCAFGQAPIWRQPFTTNHHPVLKGTGGIVVASNELGGVWTIDGSGITPGAGSAITNVSDAANAGISLIYTSNNFTIKLATFSAGSAVWLTNNGTNIVIAGQSTNGFVTQTITNGLATISYVNGATNGLVTASVTNGLATISYVDTATNTLAANGRTELNSASNSLITTITSATNTLASSGRSELNSASNSLVSQISAVTNGLATIAYVVTATNTLSGNQTTALNNASNSLLTQVNGSLANKVDELNGVATNLATFKTNVLYDATSPALVLTNSAGNAFAIYIDSLNDLGIYDIADNYEFARFTASGLDLDPDNASGSTASVLRMLGQEALSAQQPGGVNTRILSINADGEWRIIAIGSLGGDIWYWTQTNAQCLVLFTNSASLHQAGPATFYGAKTNKDLTASKLIRSDANQRESSSAYDDSDLVSIATNKVRVAPGAGTTITTNYTDGGVTYVVADTEVSSPMVLTNFVINQVYTNTSTQPILVIASAYLTPALANGDCSLDLMYSQTGGTGYALLSRVAIDTLLTGGITLPITNVISGVITNLGSFYFTNTSSGVGNSAGLVGAGTGQYTVMGGGAIGPAGANGNNGIGVDPFIVIDNVGIYPTNPWVHVTDEEFAGGDPTSTGSQQAWTALTTGNAIRAQELADGTDNAVGYMSCWHTNSTAVLRLIQGSSTGTANQLLATNIEIIAWGRIKTSNTNTTTDVARATLGVTTGGTGQEPTDGIYIGVNTNVNTNTFIFNTARASTHTFTYNTHASNTWTAGTWVNVGFRLDSTGKSATFFVGASKTNLTTVATNTTDIPDSVRVSATWTAQRIAGNGATLFTNYIDRFQMWIRPLSANQ